MKQAQQSINHIALQTTNIQVKLSLNYSEVGTKTNQLKHIFNYKRNIRITKINSTSCNLSSNYLLQLLKRVNFEWHPALNGLSGDSTEPSRPPSRDLLSFYILMLIPQSNTHRARTLQAQLPRLATGFTSIPFFLFPTP